MSHCDRVLDALAEGKRLDAALRSHADGCADCRALVAADERMAYFQRVAPAETDEDLPPALREALARDARPVKALDPWRRAMPVVAVAVALAAVMLMVRPRGDLAHQSAAHLGLGLGAVVSGLAVSLVLLLHGGRSGLGLPARLRWTVVAVVFACFELVTAAVTVPVEGSVHLAGAEAWQARVLCGLHGTLFAAAAGLVVFYGARRSAAVSPVTAGAVAGLGAGLVGALVQHLHCPVMDLDHTLVSHVAPLVVGVALGSLSGRRWLAP